VAETRSAVVGDAAAMTDDGSGAISLRGIFGGVDIAGYSRQDQNEEIHTGVNPHLDDFH
jgi:hypothetical protein